MATVNYEFIGELSKDISSDIRSKAKQDQYGIDIATIITILSVALKFFEYILQWYNGSQSRSAKSLKSFGFMKRHILWRYIRKETEDKKTARYIYYSFIDKVRNLSEEERAEIFN